MRMRLALVVGIGMALTVGLAVTAVTETRTPLAQVDVFTDNGIHFSPEEPSRFATELVQAEDNGRVICRTVELPSPTEPVRIMAHLIVKPIPADELTVHDKWDRAGNVRLSTEGQPDCEIIKFITAYGGRTEYEVDVSHLAPLLRGPVTIKTFIDTWVSPAWTIDFNLTYHADSLTRTTDWVLPIAFVESFDRATYADTGMAIDVNIPADQKRVLLHYYVSGHCTDGRDADEFVKKDNVISVDGVVVYRYQPWRDDCRRFRDINPYTRRWSDGWWSSDYSRSGWCPGDMVAPLELDLTDHLPPGEHTVRLVIENIRPKDAEDHYGYWRVSAQLLGVND